MPTVTADDLRVRLGFAEQDWDADDRVRADAVLASARTVVIALAGADRVARAEHDHDEAKLAAIDEAVVAYAVPIFANPERALQRRLPVGSSTSFSDGSDAATGLREVRTILSAAGFTARNAGRAFVVPGYGGP